MGMFESIVKIEMWNITAYQNQVTSFCIWKCDDLHAEGSIRSGNKC